MSETEDFHEDSQFEISDIAAGRLDLNELDSASDSSESTHGETIGQSITKTIESMDNSDSDEEIRIEASTSFSKNYSDDDQSNSQPEDSVSDPEILEVKMVENGNSGDSFSYVPVIDVDSEEEIDNLESEGESEAEKSLGNDENTSKLASLVQQYQDENLADELSDDAESDATASHVLQVQREPVATSRVPIIIKIGDDSFLLIPYEGKLADSTTEDMISLFNWDEIQSCTLHDLFSLIRGNGDLFESYDFDMNDEFNIQIPELRLSFGEDNVHTRTRKLEELVSYFHTLSENEGVNSPAQLTMLLSMQPRFISQLNTVTRVAEAHGGFTELYSASSDHGESVEQDPKRRKLAEV